jgi:hypothetical protein
MVLLELLTGRDAFDGLDMTYDEVFASDKLAMVESGPYAGFG